MNFVLLLKGEGEGCDYTIGCNLNYETFEADSVEDAIDYALEQSEPHGEIDIEVLQLFQVAEEIQVGLESYRSAQVSIAHAAAKAKQEAADRAELARLKAKFGE